MTAELVALAVGERWLAGDWRASRSFDFQPPTVALGYGTEVDRTLGTSCGMENGISLLRLLQRERRRGVVAGSLAPRPARVLAWRCSEAVAS
jgi:hypothetical protein